MHPTIPNSNNINYAFGEVNDRKNDTKPYNISKDAQILNCHDHALLMDAEAKLAEPEWDRDTRQLVLDILSEDSAQPDLHNYDALLNANENKDDFIRLVISNAKGENITNNNNGHLLTCVSKKEVSEFKEKIASMIKTSPEKTELLLKNGTYGLAQKIQSDRWGDHCCQKVMKLVDFMWDGSLTKTVSDNEHVPHTVNNANLHEHVNNHFSKQKDRHSSATIDRTQFLRLLLAAKNQQGASSPSREEVQQLQTSIEKELAERPSTSQQALIPEHNPFANTEEITFSRVENGRSLSQMTLAQKGTWLLNASYAAKGICAPELNRPDRKHKAPPARITGKADPVPPSEKDKFACPNKTPDADKTFDADNTVSWSTQTLITTAAAAAMGGPKAAVAAIAANMATPIEATVLLMKSLWTDERTVKLKSKLLDSIKENINVDIKEPPGEMIKSALKHAYEWTTLSHNAEERLENDKIMVNVDPSYFPVLYAKAKILGEKIEKGFSPIEVASGMARKFIEENSSTFRNILNIGWDFTWPDDYPDHLKSAINDGSILSIVEDKFDAALDNPTNREDIKEALRSNAELMANIYNLTHPRSPAGKLTHKDLENVTQLVFHENVLSNMFLHKGYIFSLNPAFEPISYNSISSSLHSPLPKPLREEIDAGLSQRRVIQLAGEDKAMNIRNESPPFNKVLGLLPGQQGKVENILTPTAIEHVKSDFDFSTWTRMESNIFVGAEALKAVLALFPLWGPAMKIGPMVNFGISLLSCAPSAIKAAIADNPDKQKKHIADALLALGISFSAGVLAQVKTDALTKLSTNAAQSIAKYPQSKIDVLAQFVKDAAAITQNSAKGGIKSLAEIWRTMPPGAKMLLARVTGNSGNLLYAKLSKLFADENETTTASTASTAASSPQTSEATTQAQGVRISPTTQTADDGYDPSKAYHVSRKGESLWSIAMSYKSNYKNSGAAFWMANKDRIPGKPFLVDELPAGTLVEMPKQDD
ncbi:hypothetical protein [Pantoea sp.]|uniref:hypothetical protein n=1 Tax=Pantoea sp. TaxID=69393 RepID=UPI0028B174AA|nr:hypothetical protein [Pantoea sp.]